MADVVLQQRLRPDSEASRAVQHASAPGTLVDEAVVAARVRQRVEGRQRNLNKTWTSHTSSRRQQWRLAVGVSRGRALRVHHAHRVHHAERVDLSGTRCLKRNACITVVPTPAGWKARAVVAYGYRFGEYTQRSM